MGGSRLRVASLIATFVILAVPGSALAHAELQRSIPDNGETLTDPVTVVTGTYSQDLAANSKLLVKDASGATVATGTVDPGNVRRMVARPDAPLENGTYEVQSTSVSADDGDIERVQWTFTVAVAASLTDGGPVGKRRDVVARGHAIRGPLGFRDRSPEPEPGPGRLDLRLEQRDPADHRGAGDRGDRRGIPAEP